MSLYPAKFLRRAFCCSLVATDSGTDGCRCIDLSGSRKNKVNRERCLRFDSIVVELWKG